MKIKIHNIIIFILLLFFTCKTSSIIMPVKLTNLIKNKKDIIIKYKSKNDYILNKYRIKKSDKEKYWEITNLVNGQKFKISWADWKIQIKGYRNWRIVESQTPIITDISIGNKYIDITFNYMETFEKNGIKYQTSVLSGILSINKKYIKINEQDWKNYVIIGQLFLNTGFIIIIFIIAL